MLIFVVPCIAVLNVGSYPRLEIVVRHGGVWAPDPLARAEDELFNESMSSRRVQERMVH